MKFWTLFDTTKGNGVWCYWQGKNSSIGSKDIENDRTEAVKLMEDPVSDPMTVVLVQPTEEDLLTLKNAFVVDWEPNIALAFRPKDFDNALLPCRKEPLNTDSWNDKMRRAVELNKKKRFMIVRDGKFQGQLCAHCPDKIKRASGACEPPVSGCQQKYFTEEQRMTTPPAGLFLSAKFCTEYEEFQSRSLEQLDVTADPNAPQYSGRDPAIIKKSWDVRFFKEIVCPACLFYATFTIRGKKHLSCPCLDGYQGWDHIRISRCGGPYFVTDIPMPSEKNRQLVRLLGSEITDKDFRNYVRTKSKERLDIPRCWRNGAGLILGDIHDCAGTATIFQTQPSIRWTPVHWVIPFEDALSLIGRESKTLPKPWEDCNLLERVTIHGWMQGRFHRVPSHVEKRNLCGRVANWGFCGISVYGETEMRGSVTQYISPYRLTTIDIGKGYDEESMLHKLMEWVPELFRSMISDKRSACFLELLAKRHVEPVRKFVQKMTQRAALNQEQLSVAEFAQNTLKVSKRDLKTITDD